MPVRKSRGAGGSGPKVIDPVNKDSVDGTSSVTPTALAKTVSIIIGERTDLELRADWNGTINGVFGDFNTFRVLTFTGEVPGRWTQYLSDLSLIIDWRATVLRPERTDIPNTFIDEYNIKGTVTRKIVFDNGATDDEVIITYNKSADLTADYTVQFKDVVPPTADVKTLHYAIEITYSSGGAVRAHEYQTAIKVDPAYVELSDHLEMEFAQRKEGQINGSDIFLYQDGLDRGSVLFAREVNRPNFFPVPQDARRYTSISKETKHVHKKIDNGVPYKLEDQYDDGILPRPFLTGSSEPTLVIYKFHFVVTAGTAKLELKKDSHTLHSYTETVMRGEYHFTDKEFEGDTNGKYLDLSWQASNDGSTDITIDGFHSVEFLQHTGIDLPGQEELLKTSYPLTNTLNTGYANLTRPIYVDEFKKIIGIYHHDVNAAGQPTYAGEFNLYPPLMEGEWSSSGTYTAERSRYFGVAYNRIPLDMPWCRVPPGYFYQRWIANPVYTSSFRTGRCTRFEIRTVRYSSSGGSFTKRNLVSLIGVPR